MTAAIEDDPRASALAFTEGVRAGWLASDLLAWVEEHLVRPGRLATEASRAGRCVQEHDAGMVVLSSEGRSIAGPEQRLATSRVPLLLAAARKRVLLELGAALSAGDLGFVHAALYAGRVQRTKALGRESVWGVRVDDSDALSDQVLALFAADALRNPQAYDADLAICDACGAVSFEPAARTSRRGCAAHPFGASEARPHGAGSMRPGPAARS